MPHPKCITTLGPSGCYRVRCNLSKTCVAESEAARKLDADLPAPPELPDSLINILADRQTVRWLSFKSRRAMNVETITAIKAYAQSYARSLIAGNAAPTDAEAGEPDSALRAEPAGQHEAALAVLSAVRDGIPLQEPVSIRKAVLAHREARVSLAGGAGPVACAMLVNIQLTGWKDGPETAEAFATGFNNAINWYRDGLLAIADKASNDAATRCRAEGGNTNDSASPVLATPGDLTDEKIDNELESAREYIVEGFGYKYNETDLAAAIRRLASNAGAAPGWIDTDERLPEDGQDVIILYWPYDNHENERVAGSAHHVAGTFYDEDGNDMHPPSHWMPLNIPAAPSDTLPVGATQEKE